MNKINVVFIGGLGNGLIVYDYLKSNKYVELSLVITYKDQGDKPRHINFPDKKNIIKDNSANSHIERIKKINPDLIIVAGWSELLKKELINIPEMGTIGFHPAKLPFNRGRSVVAWQIEEGYSETALTMFYYTDYPDGGDIIAQETFKIENNDYVNDILNKIDSATYNLMKAYFPLIRQKKGPRKKQNINDGSFRRLRTDKDSLINWDSNSVQIYNKIRAISKPYPGALAEIKGIKYRIWRSEIIDFNIGNNQKPGTLIAELFDQSLIIKTRDSFIKITEYSKN